MSEYFHTCDFPYKEIKQHAGKVPGTRVTQKKRVGFPLCKNLPGEKAIGHNYLPKNSKRKRMATDIATQSNRLASQKELQQRLINCAIACENCETSCLNEDNITLLARCIELTRDCADICLLAARLVQRQSEIEEEFLLVVEKMCRMCAEECRKHNHDHCKACAEECEACAEACHM
jgi:hypothetical protein